MVKNLAYKILLFLSILSLSSCYTQDNKDDYEYISERGKLKYIVVFSEINSSENVYQSIVDELNTFDGTIRYYSNSMYISSYDEYVNFNPMNDGSVGKLFIGKTKNGVYIETNNIYPTLIEKLSKKFN